MKTYITFKNTKVIVKPKEKIVIYKADVSFDFNRIDLHCKHLYLYDVNLASKPQNKLLKDFNKAHTFYGIAKCNEHDQFNEIIGRRIAESRCKQKIYKAYYNIYKQIYKYIMSDVSYFKKTMDHVQHCLNTEIKHKCELINETTHNANTMD